MGHPVYSGGTARTEPCGDRISPADGEDGGDVERQPAKQPLREKNRKNCAYRHVPHKDKPPQVVARRNARERRRVQAVNTAFVRLRKAVPVQNTRGKRISKVKTLQNAIEYIRALQRILQEQGSYGFSYEIFQGKYVHYKDGISYFDDLNFEDSNE
ncbi:hypothetical protein NQ318_014519 [Aromia moschata]|uniref:BHLH domain-containing protein n=1 Tax=Aromia moschata TaxID=1265417 RepID=A0AAV8YMI9_9CUCU|nr:hypothetical protein NQ318_014519 [Aromia moschata]